MKQHLIPLIAAALLTAAACTTEDYYRSANLSPELTASVDLDLVDTIKTSAASSQRTYAMSVSGVDENLNMNMLLVNAPTGSVKIDGIATNSLAIETAKERSKFTHGVEFTPNSDGLHTITARVTDDFGNFNSVEKQVYSFTNMRPKLGITYTSERRNYMEVHHNFDFSTSYDRDSKWGGTIDSIYVKLFMAEGLNLGYTEEECSSLYYYGVNTTGLVLNNIPVFDDGSEFTTTDIWCWVKDNEGAVSDTLHIPYVHVE